MGWRRFLRREKWDRERREELESYVRIETDANIARGMPPAGARHAAQRKLGNPTLIREEIYRMNTVGFVDALGRDLRYALRSLRHNPMFTAIAILTLGIGIGANTAIFSVVNGILLKPLSYPHSDELVALVHAAPGFKSVDMPSAPFLYFTYRQESRTFAGNGLWQSLPASVTGVAEPERIQTIQVTSEVLPLLGVEPLVGRVFSAQEDSPGRPLTAVLSYGYWQRRFGGDRSVIGRRLTLDGKAHEIIGVMPQRFRFLDTDADLFRPLQFDRSQVFLGLFGYGGIARLKPGVTLAQAAADVARMIPIAVESFPPSAGSSREQFRSVGLRPNLRSLKQQVVGDVGDTLWVLMGTIGLVLLIACANVANLLLVRADGRQQELAVRAALGAGWGRLARELLVESAVLGLAGGVLGLGLAYTGLRLLVANGPANLPRMGEIAVDPTVLLFALAASLFSGLLFGLIPVAKYARPRLGTALQAGGRRMSASRERHRARGALVVAQVALALVLLICSGLMLRTFQSLSQVDPGFTGPQEVQTLRLNIPEAQVPEPERATRMLNQIVDRLAAIPGVTSVAFGSSAPMGGQMTMDILYAEGDTYAGGKLPPPRRFKFISPGFFRTLGTPLVAGRDLEWIDFYDRRHVAVVSEELARAEWGTPAAALRQHIRATPNDPWREIVGVVGDVREDGVSQPSPATAYFPVLLDRFWTAPTFLWRSVTVMVRTPRAGSESFLRELQEAVWAVNGNLAVAEVRTLGDLYEGSLARTSFTLVLLAIAGSMALVLGIIGIYGVLSYAVSQRRREIGIRLALGAQPGELKTMFVRHGLVLASMGVAIGLGAAAVLTRFMSSLLFGIRPLDPLTYAAGALLLGLAAALASYLPARRAAAVDPVEALKAE